MHRRLNLTLLLTALLLSAAQTHAQNCDVTWTKAASPHLVSGSVTVPANQTVCIEPGVEVRFSASSQLTLLGKISGIGTAAEPIKFTNPNSDASVLVQGTLDLSYGQIGLQLSLNKGTLLCRNSSFGSQGLISGGFASFLSLENVVFDSNDPIQSSNAAIYASSLTAILKNITFRNRAFFTAANSFFYVQNVTSENSAYDGLSFGGNFLQPIYLNNVTVTNSVGAGLVLSSGNYELGSSVVLQNTENPIRGDGGLLPGSQVPAAGNRNNFINATAGIAGTTYAPVAVPYVMSGFSGGLNLLPGVQIKLRSNGAFSTMSGTLRALGLPGAPIVIEPFVAGQKWKSGQFNSEGDRFEYVTLDGSDLGIVNAGGAGATFYIDNSILRNHGTAIQLQDFVYSFLQGNLFTNNTLAIAADEGTRASGLTNPNLFEGNGTALSAPFNTNPDARYNWWNSPTGPKAPNNPGGSGEIINGTAQISPFRTARPDPTDHPPVVRIVGGYQRVFQPGSQVLLSWTSSDNRQIAKQKISFSVAGNIRDTFTVVADNLPAAQRSYLFTVPNIGFQVSGSRAFIRIAAFDDRGQEGWDEWQALIPSGEETGVLQITSPVAGQTFVAPADVPLTWTVTQAFQNTSFEGVLLLDADDKMVALGGGDTHGTFATPRMPFVSTDTARFAVHSVGSINRQKWFYSQPFAIRPDSRWADAPPQISLVTPTNGQQFNSRGVMNISWNASDDDALRRFNIQASFDQGRTWQAVVENLPPLTSSYAWQLPPNGGAASDARIRVIAVDRRFQNTSANRSFALTNVAMPVTKTYTRESSGAVRVNWTGTPGATYTIETSSDQQSWTRISTATAAAGTGAFDYYDTQTAGVTARSYRARP